MYVYAFKFEIVPSSPKAIAIQFYKNLLVIDNRHKCGSSLYYQTRSVHNQITITQKS